MTRGFESRTNIPVVGARLFFAVAESPREESPLHVLSVSVVTRGSVVTISTESDDESDTQDFEFELSPVAARVLARQLERAATVCGSMRSPRR